VDGIHDLGGMEGFGPPVVEADEPVFHFEWERRALGITFGTFAIGLSNGGQFRHSIERMDPGHYLATRYYEHWFTGVATRLVETGRMTLDELEARAGGRVPLSRPVAQTGIEVLPPTPGIAIGDQVRVRHVSTRGHTRCPQYVRGRRGVVVRVDGESSLPDMEAHFDERRIEPICSVRFTARELWGDGAEDALVHVDLWSSYLEKMT
jgi:nitrile hydratase